MKYFRVTFEWKTRPWYRKGRVKTHEVTVAANDQTEAYKTAQEIGAKRFYRHKWGVLSVEEIRVGGA